MECDAVGHTIEADVSGGVETGVIQCEPAVVGSHAGAAGKTAQITQHQSAATDDRRATVSVVVGQSRNDVAGTCQREAAGESSCKGAVARVCNREGGCRTAGDGTTGSWQRGRAVDTADCLVVAIEIENPAADTDTLQHGDGGSWEHGQRVHSAIQNQFAAIDGSLAAVDEELTAVDAHVTSSSLDEAVAALDVGVKIQNVAAVHLMEDELIATRLNDATADVVACGAGIEHQQTAAADVEQGGVVDPGQSRSSRDRKAVDRHRPEAL